jgi:FkbM family methyltransferase
MGFGIKTKLFKVRDYFFERRFPLARKLINNDTTQYGEFSVLWKLLGRENEKTVVEVGANNGFFCSNSYPFILRGWNSILIEPNPEVFRQLQRFHANRNNVTLFQCACGSSETVMPLYLGKDGETGYSTLSNENSDWYNATRGNKFIYVSVKPLNDILKEAFCPENFGFLSIDTEGYDYEVLSGVNLERFRPKVIMTEDEKPPFTNAQLKNNLLLSNNYQLDYKIRSNAIWVRKI